MSASAVLGSANAGAIMASFGTQLKPVSLNVLAIVERPRRTSPPIWVRPAVVASNRLGA